MAFLFLNNSSCFFHGNLCPVPSRSFCSFHTFLYCPPYFSADIHHQILSSHFPQLQMFLWMAGGSRFHNYNSYAPQTRQLDFSETTGCLRLAVLCYSGTERWSTRKAYEKKHGGVIFSPINKWRTCNQHDIILIYLSVVPIQRVEEAVKEHWTNFYLVTHWNTGNNHHVFQ